MYTDFVIDHKAIAGSIYERLKLDYKYAKPKDVTMEEAKASLAIKLQELKDYEVLCWKQALEDLAHGRNGHPPSAQEIYFAIKRVGFRSVVNANTNKPTQPTVNDEIDYAALWNSADDKAKFRFFIDHKFNDVPPYVRYWFIKYNREHRGWSSHESGMMIGYWKLPFTNAHEGAVIKNQGEIRKYFEERNAD